MFGFILQPPFRQSLELQRSLEKVPDKQHQPCDHGQAQAACEDELYVVGHGVGVVTMTRSFVYSRGNAWSWVTIVSALYVIRHAAIKVLASIPIDMEGERKARCMACRVPGVDLQACPGPDTRASDFEYKDGHGIAAVEAG
ncbi:hypothetical protein [Thiobacillus sp.]|uniref:hypothetical protein n=1 Tax=Thiobacillus sp. TaxID=924 RepID=UPI0025EBDD78|nr:hypothetical protein [Thiobacillus sp.]